MTSEMPNDTSATPPAAPADGANRQRNIIIAVVVAVVLLCCCCCALAVGVYFWQNGDTLLDQFSRLLPALAALA